MNRVTEGMSMSITNTLVMLRGEQKFGPDNPLQMQSLILLGKSPVIIQVRTFVA